MIPACGGARKTAPASTTSPPPIRLDTLAEKRAAFAQAYASLRHGRPEAALPVFTALTDGYPELMDYHLYFTGVCDAKLDWTEAAEAPLDRLLREYPQSVKAHAAALELGKLLLRDDRLARARPLLESALTAPDSATVLGARFALAESDERQGDTATAYAGFMRVRRDALGTAVARAAKEKVLALRAEHPEFGPGGSDLLDEARLLLQEHDYAATLRTAQQVLDQGEGVEPSEAVRVRADALYGLGQVEAALATLREVVDGYPSSAAASGALFRLASILWNRDRDAEALRAFAEFGVRYGTRAQADEALYAAGRIHERAGRREAAIRAFAELATRFPRSSVAAEARWRIGWIHYMAGEWTAAANAYAELAAQPLSSRLHNEAAYWQARALERAGRRGAVRAIYRDIIEREPADYYALWAERRLGVAADAASGGRVVAPPDTLNPGPPPLADSFHLTRWNELRAVGVSRLAVGELAAIDREHPGDRLVARYLLGAYQEVEGYAAAVRLLRRLGEGVDLSPDERERLLYPLAFWPSVRREADANGVDPLLVEAIMRQESLFDPDAHSSADARGLMQLLASTAARLTTKGGIDLTEPDLNIQLGTRYLQTLLARFGSDTMKALAAYNGGEAAVEKWQRRFPDLDADEFVENISYRETRDYVKRVVTNYRKYQQLYAAGASPG